MAYAELIFQVLVMCKLHKRLDEKTAVFTVSARNLILGWDGSVGGVFWLREAAQIYHDESTVARAQTKIFCPTVPDSSLSSSTLGREASITPAGVYAFDSIPVVGFRSKSNIIR